MDPENRGGDESCPLGVAVLATGLVDVAQTCPALGISDQYEPQAGSVGTYISTTGSCAVLQWSYTGCGWVVTAPAPDVAPDTPTGPGACNSPFCSNDVYAANWIFGTNDASEYKEDICEDTEPWLSTGYCANKLWQALCPESCPTLVDCDICSAWANDNEEAAAVVTTMLELVVEATTSCNVLKQVDMCTDPVVARVCPFTCSTESRRLSELRGKARQQLLSRRSKFGMKFRSALNAIEAALEKAGGRRLGLEAGGMRTEIYGTWDPTMRPDFCAAAKGNFNSAKLAPPDEGLISGSHGDGLFDFFTFDKPVPFMFTITKNCPLQRKYITKSNIYCKDNNLVINQPTTPKAVVDQLCWEKCIKSGTLEAFGSAPGPPYYCDGADPAFNMFSNALCVPRDECEAICNSMDNCYGIEMHRTLPRCYLNLDGCGADDAEYVMSDEYDMATKTMGEVSYTTHTKRLCAKVDQFPLDSLNMGKFSCLQKCNGGDPVACAMEQIAPGYVCASRETAELLCEQEMDCAGFNMMIQYNMSKFMKMADIGDFTPNNFCTDGKVGAYDPVGSLKFVTNQETTTLRDTLNDYLADSSMYYVEKNLTGGTGVERWILPCTADIFGHPNSNENGLYKPVNAGSGECADMTYVGSCYVSSSGYSRLVYQGHYSFDESQGYGLDRKCDGWAMQLFDGMGYSSMYSTLPNGTCPSASPTANLMPYYGTMFRWRPDKIPTAQLSYVCKSYPTCGTLMTCVLAKGRFATELNLMLKYSDAPVEEKKAQVISELPGPSIQAMLKDEEFHPKTLISVERAVAFIARTKWAWASELYRNVPGHLRMKIRDPGNFDKAIITMVSAEGSESMRELGKDYDDMMPEGYEPWYTDVIRIERFDRSLQKLSGNIPMVIDVYAPTVPKLFMYHFDVVTGTRTPVPTAGAPDYPGWYTVTVMADGDYVGTTMSPCPVTPPAVANRDPTSPSVCPDTNPGAQCPLKCASGFVPSGNEFFTCSLGKWSEESCVAARAYSPEKPYFRLTHRSRLDYGWRIRQLFVYSDPGCTVSIPDVQIISTSGDYDGFPSAGLTDSGDMSMVPESTCVQNAGACADWWSQGLNVNPYEVDETHGEATFVDFAVPENADVQCVRIVSRSKGPGGVDRMYYPKEMVLYRGWLMGSNARKEGVEFMDSPILIDGWTEFWTTTADAAGGPSTNGQVTDFSTSCGLSNTMLFGELIDYVQGVPSPCHCKQLCIDMIDAGCRSFKYRIGTPTLQPICYLQGEIISISTGGEGDACQDFSGFVSGDTGLRLTDVAPKAVVPGKPFSLTVSGVNMPTVETVVLRGTTPARQRVKIVDAAAVCAEGAVAEAVVGIGCSHPYFCAPKPGESSSDMASWSGISIHSSSADVMYKVCYNMGMTFDRYQWYDVPGVIMVGKSTFSWTTMPKMIARTTEDFSLSVMRPSFTSSSNPSGWMLKIIRSYFDCATVATDVEKIGLSETNAAVVDMDAKKWSSISVYDVAGQNFADVGKYKVCFSEGAGMPFSAIPSAEGGLYFEIEAEEGYSLHPRDVFSHQMLSGRLGVSNTLTLAGHRLYVPSTSAIGVKDGPCDSETPMVFTVTVDEDMSSPDAYVFSTVLPLGSTPGTYDLCYCESRTDTTPDKEAGGKLYRLQGVTVGDQTMSGASRCSSTPLAQVAISDSLATGLLPKDYVSGGFADHFCAKKCARGCVRQDCFCDSFDPDTMYDEATVDLMTGYAAPLCLSASLCRDACSASPYCEMFDYEPATNFCWLLTATPAALGSCEGGDLNYDESTETWARVNGSACTNTTDFTQTVGTITLSRRADIGNDWVLTPSAGVGTDYVPVQSLEVTGTAMDWTKDRVMLVECTGTCGVSGPAASVRSLVGVGSPGIPSQAAFNAWVAENDMMDAPAEDFLPSTPPVSAPVADSLLGKFTGQYCAGNNMDVTTPDMMAAGVGQHQCYKKCVTDAPCDASSPDCFCDGLFPGYDDEDSAALCLDVTTCRAYCASLPDCFGIDMHQTMNRCFLNGMTKGPNDEKSCMEYVFDMPGAMPTYSYDFYFKQSAVRRLEAEPAEPEPEAPARKLQYMEPVDQGLSWDQILRFKGLAFASGGKFKACFCDTETLPANSACSTAADYKVEIGTVHVSGVSCLIEEPKFQRGVCVSQYHGGMRCYKEVAPTLTVPPPPAPGVMPTPKPTAATPGATPSPTPMPTAAPTPPPTVPSVLSTFCFYGPEEETKDDPNCQWSPR
jgi:hypothetical protein